jgi:hypothetical protein
VRVSSYENQQSIIAHFVICAISASFRDGDFLTVQELRERQRAVKAGTCLTSVVVI